jgi:hypothetical protein
MVDADTNGSAQRAGTRGVSGEGEGTA